MTAAPATLSLFHGLGHPADDPAIVQVWDDYCAQAVEDELCENARSRAAVLAAFVPLALASMTMDSPPVAR